MRSRGYSVPRDVSVIGLERVVSLLDDGESPVDSRLISARLAIRESTTAAVRAEG